MSRDCAKDLGAQAYQPSDFIAPVPTAGLWWLAPISSRSAIMQASDIAGDVAVLFAQKRAFRAVDRIKIRLHRQPVEKFEAPLKLAC